MYLDKLKDMFNKTKAELPPHYPTKTHDIQDSLKKLIMNLREIIEYIGLTDANIAIKNMISKSISSLLIVAKELNTDLILNEIKLDNGKKIVITSKDDVSLMEITYLNDGIIRIENMQKLNHAIVGEDYSSTTLIYNVNNPNELTILGRFFNRLQYNYISTFSDDGIEQKRKFSFTSSKSSVTGSYERNDDFFSGNLNVELKGSFRNFNDQQIKDINSLGELTMPIMSNHDLNLLTLATENEKRMRFPNGITFQTNNYTHYEEVQEFFKEDYDTLINCVYDNPYSLEINPNLAILNFQIIHGAYSEEILLNIKNFLKQNSHRK